MNAHPLNPEASREPYHAASIPLPRAADRRLVEPVVTLRHAAAQRGGRQLWRALDLTVTAGEFVAVLGPNGVGKSTLVQVILGALPLAEGEVRVLGGPAGRAHERIGYLPQRRSFDSSLRVRGRDIVQLGLDGHRWGLPLPAWWPGGAARRAASARVGEVIDLVGASAYAERPVGELSGGEQQRLLIAQALAPAPELLLLDEPLDSLDLPNQAAVAALIARISRTQRVAVMMVAHDVNPILPHLDTVVYLAPGGSRIGPPGQVVTGPTLTQLFGTPIEVLTASDGRLVVIGQPDRSGVHVQRRSGPQP
ncbi:MAG: ATP-binding cassette domain-containing protein [Pseudonocardiales bacterium]|nr:ATP-binding cassette domain-containing protein [Pseudonocardiales bacterium]